jgi:hypothetical protein
MLALARRTVPTATDTLYSRDVPREQGVHPLSNYRSGVTCSRYAASERCLGRFREAPGIGRHGAGRSTGMSLRPVPGRGLARASPMPHPEPYANILCKEARPRPIDRGTAPAGREISLGARGPQAAKSLAGHGRPQAAKSRSRYGARRPRNRPSGQRGYRSGPSRLRTRAVVARGSPHRGWNAPRQKTARNRPSGQPKMITYGRLEDRRHERPAFEKQPQMIMRLWRSPGFLGERHKRMVRRWLSSELVRTSPPR